MSQKNNNEQLVLDDYDEKTGELKGINKFKFRSMWYNPYKIESQDLSNEFEET